MAKRCRYKRKRYRNASAAGFDAATLKLDGKLKGRYPKIYKCRKCGYWHIMDRDRLSIAELIAVHRRKKF